MWKQSNNSNDQVLRQFYNQRRKRNQNIKQHNLLKKNVSYFQQLQQNYQQSQIMVPLENNNQQFLSEQFQIPNARKTLQKNKSIEPQQYGGLQKQNVYFSEYQLKRDYNYMEQPMPTFGTISKQKSDQDCSITSRQRSFSNPFKKVTENFNEQSKENLLINDFRKTKKNSQSMNKRYFQNKQIQLLEEPKKQEITSKQQDISSMEQQIGSKQQEQKKIQSDNEYIKELQNKIKFQDKFIQSIQKMRRAIQKVDENCSLKQLWRWIKKLPQQHYE